MVKRALPGLMIATGMLAVLWGGSAQAYNQYNDSEGGCVPCHGAFTDDTSTKGSIFPGNDKHTMHRSTQNMNTSCGLCHRADDGNNPFIGSSDGAGTVPGLGCLGCHPAPGLRAHHANGGVSVCADCHSGDPTPAPENVPPAYYGTAETNVNNPCNAVATTGVNENWTTNCCLGSDTDGDGLYDTADPDCSGPVSTPGEAGAGASPLRVTAFDKISGALTVTFGTACSSTNNNIEYGPLSSVATYGYSGQVCNVGTAGATFTLPTGSQFFLVVAHGATKEGSYGKRRTGATLTERPEDATSATCPYPQDLTLRCD